MPFDNNPLEDTRLFDFPVEERQLYWRADDPGDPLRLPCYQPIDPSRNRAIVRTDTGEVLGVHGARYKLRPYREAIERICEAIATAAPDQKIEVKDSLFDKGARMRREITFPDLKIEPQVGDLVAFKVDLWNSYDGGWAEQYLAWALRLWCLNGCTTAGFSVRSAIRHVTTGWKREDHIERIKRAVEMFFRSEEQYRRWISREITWDQAESLFKRTIACNDDRKRPPEERYSRPKLALLMNKFDLEPQTLWGAYNAATNWASHAQTRGAAHNVERDRHNQVAKMLKSDLWARLAA